MKDENASDSDGPNGPMFSLLSRSKSHRSMASKRSRRSSRLSGRRRRNSVASSMSGAQISVKEGSDRSIGETDDDVFYPGDDTEGIDLEQLNQLLNTPSSSPLEQLLLNAQIKSPTDLKVPFLPGQAVPPMALPQAQQPKQSSTPPPQAQRSRQASISSVSTNERSRYSFFGSKLGNTIHASDLRSLVNPRQSFATLFNPDVGVWWLDCDDPTEQELKVLAKAFSIHPLTTDDIRTGDSAEKFEVFENYYFVCFHTFGNNPVNREYYLESLKFYILVFEGGVVTFHTTPLSHCRNVRRRARQIGDYIQVTSDWICYALIDDITDMFAPIMLTVEKSTDHIEDSVYTGGDMSGMLEQLSETRKTTMSLLRLLSGKAGVIRGYVKRCEELWSGRAQFLVPYLSDIEDHIETMAQNLAAYEKILGRSHTNYMTFLQLEFVNSSNRMTSVLSKAALMGTILLPMTLVAGMFGVNVQVPGKEANNLGWFFGIVGTMIVVVLCLSYLASLWLKRWRA